MIFGYYENGKSCAYDLPTSITTAENFERLIIGYNDNPAHREELQGQPILKGYAGPMFNGFAKRASNGEIVAVIRYEDHSKKEA